MTGSQSYTPPVVSLGLLRKRPMPFSDRRERPWRRRPCADGTGSSSDSSRLSALGWEISALTLSLEDTLRISTKSTMADDGVHDYLSMRAQTAPTA